MQNKKIQSRALSIAGYNCQVKYIEDRFNCCTDILSRLSDVTPKCELEDQSEYEEPDIKDNFFEIDVFYFNTFFTKEDGKM